MGENTPKLESSQAYGGPCPVEPPVWHRLRDSAVSFSTRLAIASLHQPPTLYGISPACPEKEYLRWSYAELSNAVDCFAANLQRLGAARSKALATFLHNGVEFVLAFWAAHKIGCVFVPLNPRSLINDKEVSYMLRTAGVSIVIVQDITATKQFDSLPGDIASKTTKIVLSEPQPGSSWVAFETLMITESDTTTSTSDKPSENRTEEDVVAVLFTSGTTSVPKGAPHNNTTLNAFCQNLSLGGRSETDVFCSVLPNNHAMGYFYVLHFMMNGAAIVYAYGTFDADRVINALESEKSTHMALVPAALYSLLEALKDRTALDSSLVDVCLAGSSVTPENLHSVIKQLRSKRVSTGFGMTEGSPIWTAPKESPEALVLDNMTISGKASPGAFIRVCDPISHEILPIGVRGELHQSGPGLIKEYLGRVGKEHFYTDQDGVAWFITGDQAVMHGDGRVSISGRYKDIITRGSENIAPAAIEATISRFCDIQVQIIGAADPIAGQVPVAVVKTPTKISLKDIHQVVLREMGTIFVPVELISLEELGLENFPKTLSGKIQKSKLTSLVDALRSQRQGGDAESNTALNPSIKRTLLKAYYKSTGIESKDLDLDAPVSSFADSLATMRVRNLVRRELGFTLTMKEMTDNSTIASQIIRLGEEITKNNTSLNIKKSSSVLPPHAPTIDDMSILFGSTDQAAEMKDTIVKAVQAGGLPNGFDEVAAILPVYDYMQVILQHGIVQSWNFAIAVLTNGTSTEELREALKKTLTNHPILTSLYVLDQSQNPVFVMLKPSSRLWDICILDNGSLQTAVDVQQLAIQYPHREHATAPGPLFRCLIVHIEETNSAAMVMYVHHLVHDASSLRLFYEDLEQAIKSPSKDLLPHLSYKAWAESYQALRNSPEATASVSYHINRLSNLHLHKHALYPRASLPRTAITEDPDGLDYGFDVPYLLPFKKAYPTIAGSTIVKAAMALVNVNRTGHSHAIFNNAEAGRGQFPFIPESVQEVLHPTALESSDVNGPMIEHVCNLIQVPRDESAISLLRRLQAEQLELTKHSHAPLRHILSRLATQGNGADDLMVDIQHAQFLSWVPGFMGEYEKLRIAHIAIRCTIGLAIVGSLGGPLATTYLFTVRWDVANFSRQETAEFMADLEAAILWLTAPDNWDKPVSHILAALEKAQEMRQMYARVGESP